MKRKLCSVLVTAALLLSTTLPAFADDESAPSTNETSACAELAFDSDSASASEEGTVEEDNSSNDMSDAPSPVEGFTEDDSVEISEAPEFSVDEEPIFDTDDIAAILDGVFESDDEPVTESVSEPDSEPVTESVSEPGGEPATETVSETSGELVTETVSETSGELVTESASETSGELVTETVSEPVEEPATESVSEPDGELVTEIVSEPDDESATETISEPVEEPATESVSEPDGELVTEIVSEPDDESATETISEPVDESATETVSETSGELVTESASETSGELVTESASETSGELVTETVSEPDDESVTESVSEPVEEPAAESVSEPDGEPATETVSEPVEEPATESASEERLQENLELSQGGFMDVQGTPLTPDENEEDFATLLGIIPTISVTIPNNAKIIINPYRMNVQQGSDTCHDEIISDTSVIVSYSDVALNIAATAIGWADIASSEVRFVSDTSDMQNKDLFVYYEFLNVSDASGEAVWSGRYSAASNQIVVQNRTDTLPTPTEVLTIPAAADSTSPSYAALRAFGSASVPGTGVWKATDTVSIRLAFTFEPA